VVWVEEDPGEEAACYHQSRRQREGRGVLLDDQLGTGQVCETEHTRRKRIVMRMVNGKTRPRATW